MRATFAIPCYNAGPHLRPLLESLLRQDEQDFDLLLVDDASTDDSVAVAQRVAGDRLRIHRNPVRLGISGNWTLLVGGLILIVTLIQNPEGIAGTTYRKRQAAKRAKEAASRERVSDHVRTPDGTAAVVGESMTGAGS